MLMPHVNTPKGQRWKDPHIYLNLKLLFGGNADSFEFVLFSHRLLLRDFCPSLTLYRRLHYTEIFSVQETF